MNRLILAHFLKQFVPRAGELFFGERQGFSWKLVCPPCGGVILAADSPTKNINQFVPRAGELFQMFI